MLKAFKNVSFEKRQTLGVDSGPKTGFRVFERA